MQEIKCPKCGEVFQVDESGYSAIVKQVRDKEFTKELSEREERFEAEKENAVQLARLEAERKFNEKLTVKENEISEYKSRLSSFDKDKELEISRLLAQKNAELAEKDNCINKLSGEKALTEKECLLREQSLKEQYEAQLRFKEEEVERYKDFKSRLSTKMIGESLEQHCELSFNQLRPTAFQGAYFEKDNDAATGSKGDYIFRDFDELGNEFISIMFEMKNEADSGSKKKKNEDFFKELDKDRREKKCEYAVLVSMLEPENELYNSGIVDVSHRYEKMYVIRPQFFIPIITLLRNAASNSIEYRKELALVKAQNIDVSNFEAEMNEFKEKFFKNVKDASARFDEAISGIDKAIKNLQNIRDALVLSEKHHNSANNKVEDLTIKKHTKNNPTMQAKFDALKIEKKK